MPRKQRFKPSRKPKVVPEDNSMIPVTPTQNASSTEQPHEDERATHEEAVSGP